MGYKKLFRIILIMEFVSHGLGLSKDAWGVALAFDCADVDPFVPVLHMGPTLAEISGQVSSLCFNNQVFFVDTPGVVTEVANLIVISPLRDALRAHYDVVHVVLLVIFHSPKLGFGVFRW